MKDEGELDSSGREPKGACCERGEARVRVLVVVVERRRRRREGK